MAFNLSLSLWAQSITRQALVTGQHYKTTWIEVHGIHAVSVLDQIHVLYESWAGFFWTVTNTVIKAAKLVWKQHINGSTYNSLFNSLCSFYEVIEIQDLRKRHLVIQLYPMHGVVVKVKSF